MEVADARLGTESATILEASKGTLETVNVLATSLNSERRVVAQVMRVLSSIEEDQSTSQAISQDITEAYANPQLHNHPELLQKRIQELEAQLRASQETTDNHSLIAISDRFDSMDINDAFNYAQTFYTWSFLSNLEPVFAQRLAHMLWNYFTPKGYTLTTWKTYANAR